METATDIATGLIVGAAQHATLHTRRVFRCPCCRQDVQLIVGEKPKPYFRHRRGVANTDCENYQPSNHGKFLSRPRTITERSDSDPHGFSILFFDLVDGIPTLYEWLPPVGSVQWSGELLFRARGTERSLKFGMLTEGKRISFLLSDGRWDSTIHGEVDPEYQARISVGPHSLDAELNVFDATRSPGRVVLPGERLTLGDAVWIVTRSVNVIDACGGIIGTLERRVDIDGWFILLAKLPDEANVVKIALLESLLRRSIRERPAKVWIEAPWPWRHQENGVPEYFVGDVPIRIRSSQPIDLEIVSLREKHTRLKSEYVTEAIWGSPVVGDWVIRVNDTDYACFAITAQVPFETSSIRAAYDGGSTIDFAAAQRHLESLLAAGTRPRAIRLDWSAPSIGALIAVDGKRISGTSQQHCEIVLNSGTTISAERLGRIVIPEKLSAGLAENVRVGGDVHLIAEWLLSVALPRSRQSPQKIAVPLVFKSDVLLQRLVGRSWSLKYAAHVRNFSRLLREHS